MQDAGLLQGVIGGGFWRATPSQPSIPSVARATISKLAQVEKRREGRGQPYGRAWRLSVHPRPHGRSMGRADINDPAAQNAAVQRLTSDNRTALTQALGREPTAGELYLAHQQGAAGAIKLLSNPGATPGRSGHGATSR